MHHLVIYELNGMQMHESYPAAKKSCYLGNYASQIKSYCERYQEVMVPLSESVMKKCVQRHLSED